ncbi:MAG: 50S ribosomal protein L11 methyltransferase [Hyphomicrobium sp.]
MTLHKISADFSDRDRAYSASGALQDLLDPPPNAMTIFENGPGLWRIEAYYESGAQNRDFDAELAAVMGGGLPRFVAEPVPELNWVAISQAALPPVTAGRFTVHGSHDVGRVLRGPMSIVIDAGEAFGTAHHATTLGCLLAIDRLTRIASFGSVLDLGSGSGVLAIAVAKALPRADIVATDLDPQSVQVATQNVRINGVASRIALTAANGVEHMWLRQSPPFDLVIANILAGPLVRLAPRLSRTVARGGVLVLSGLLIPQAAEVIAAYRTAGFQLIRHDRIAGWATLTLRRR